MRDLANHSSSADTHHTCVGAYILREVDTALCPHPFRVDFTVAIARSIVTLKNIGCLCATAVLSSSHPPRRELQNGTAVKTAAAIVSTLVPGLSARCIATVHTWTPLISTSQFLVLNLFSGFLLHQVREPKEHHLGRRQFQRHRAARPHDPSRPQTQIQPPCRGERTRDTGAIMLPHTG